LDVQNHKVGNLLDLHGILLYEISDALVLKALGDVNMLIHTEFE
jgi:hypothetical protein